MNHSEKTFRQLLWCYVLGVIVILLAAGLHNTVNAHDLNAPKYYYIIGGETIKQSDNIIEHWTTMPANINKWRRFYPNRGEPCLRISLYSFSF